MIDLPFFLPFFFENVNIQRQPGQHQSRPPAKAMEHFECQ